MLELLTGLIAFAIIVASGMSLLNQNLPIGLQALITYAESLLLRKEFRGEDGRQI